MSVIGPNAEKALKYSTDYHNISEFITMISDVYVIGPDVSTDVLIREIFESI